MTRLLIADIGGTHVRFAVADRTGLHDAQTLLVADFPGPLEAVDAYLKNHARPSRAVFAVAGPVRGDLFELTNFPWIFSVSGLSARLGFDVTLINDFHAQALAIPVLAADRVVKLGGGDATPGGSIGVMGPGTGLGVAMLIHDGHRYMAVPGEGGHVTLPVVSPREAPYATGCWPINTAMFRPSVCVPARGFSIFTRRSARWTAGICPIARRKTSPHAP